MQKELRVVKTVGLGQLHKPTGHTRHHVKGELATHFSELRIAKYEDVPGYYLFYCDEQGNELTDTYHDTLEEAIEQARLEFNVRPDEWSDASTAY